MHFDRSIVFLLGTVLSLCGCAGTDKPFGLVSPNSDEIRVTATDPGGLRFGSDAIVTAMVAAVKSAGHVRVISSKAVKLPVFPVGSITAFDYQVPTACGGHRFRVYETIGTQILEFEYAPDKGSRYVIRDYLSGPNHFARPGLWSAYDHTAEGIEQMNILFRDRGSGILVGTYSQGPITALGYWQKQTLGMAYDRALRDSLACRS